MPGDLAGFLPQWGREFSRAILTASTEGLAFVLVRVVGLRLTESIGTSPSFGFLLRIDLFMYVGHPTCKFNQNLRPLVPVLCEVSDHVPPSTSIILVTYLLFLLFKNDITVHVLPHLHQLRVAAVMKYR